MLFCECFPGKLPRFLLYNYSRINRWLSPSLSCICHFEPERLWTSGNFSLSASKLRRCREPSRTLAASRLPLLEILCADNVPESNDFYIEFRAFDLPITICRVFIRLSANPQASTATERSLPALRGRQREEMQFPQVNCIQQSYGGPPSLLLTFCSAHGMAHKTEQMSLL